jgi:hypothetical protein
MVVGLWTWSGDLKRATDRVACEGSVNLVTTLAQAMDAIEQATQAVVAQQLETRNGNAKSAPTSPASSAASTSAPAK